MTTTEEIRARREAIVIEHITAESVGEVERALRTFARPKYDCRAIGGSIVEGEEAVRNHIAGGVLATPGITYVAEKLHHTDDAVIVEYRITGTHDGSYPGIPPTGAKLDYPALAIFEFEGDGLVCERPYMNMRGMEEQMRGGD